jgi:ACS family glucarate transporter-like MFS transporter
VTVPPRTPGDASGVQPAGFTRWLLVFWIFVVAAVSYLDRNNISVAATAIQREFALTNLQLGGVFSAFVMGYAFAQPFAGRIADRYGPYRAVAVAILWWSVFTASTALVPGGFAWSVAALTAVRFTLGVGESVIFPASNRLMAAWIPPRERGLASGLIFAGVGFGAGVAPPLITYIILKRDWRSSFFVTAVIGLAVFVIWLALVRDRPENHPWVGTAEAAYIRTGAPAARLNAPPASWWMILGNKQVLLLSLSYFTYGYVAYIFFTWFFKYLSSVRGLDLKASAIYATLPFIAMAVAAPLGGWIADALTRRFDARIGRCWTAAAALGAAAVLVALATQVSDPRSASLVLAGGAGALYLSQSAYWTLSADMGGSSAGSLSGVMNMFNQIGGVITASLTPLLADHFGWSVSFEAAAGLCLLGALLLLFIDPRQRL